MTAIILPCHELSFYVPLAISATPQHHLKNSIGFWVLALGYSLSDGLLPLLVWAVVSAVCDCAPSLFAKRQVRGVKPGAITGRHAPLVE